MIENTLRRRKTLLDGYQAADCPVRQIMANACRVPNERRKMTWTEFILPTANLLTFVANQVGGYVYGSSNGEVSNSYPQIIVPPNYAFSIWFLIYVGHLAFAIYGFFARKSMLFKKGVSVFFVLYNLTSLVWQILFAEDQQYVALPVICILWVFLMILVARVYIYIHIPEEGEASNSVPIRNYALVLAPFSVNLGWVTGATLISFNLVITKASPDDHPVILAAASVTLAIIAVAAAVAAAFKWSDWIFCCTLLWPLITKTVSLKDLSTLPHWMNDLVRKSIMYSFAAICIINGAIAVAATIRFAINAKRCPWFEPTMTADDKQVSIDSRSSKRGDDQMVDDINNPGNML
eukprot:GHVO01063688.1.p1 GENE.GHVO01063688.1~~GHVO01063688.1.p1  ORF type:complete len:349 (-),score=28.42 GHVO01063688.1:205-1251(-)